MAVPHLPTRCPLCAPLPDTPAAPLLVGPHDLPASTGVLHFEAAALSEDAACRCFLPAPLLISTASESRDVCVHHGGQMKVLCVNVEVLHTS